MLCVDEEAVSPRDVMTAVVLSCCEVREESRGRRGSRRSRRARRVKVYSPGRRDDSTASRTGESRY